MHILDELRRRRVFRAAAIYVAAAWGVVEISSFLLERINAPGAIINGVAAIFVVGFPIAMLVAWFVDFSSSGIRPAAELPAGSAITVSAGMLLLLVGTLGIAVLLVREPAPEVQYAAAPLPNSVAVLPFLNMSNDPENEYFSDGLSDMLIDRLANVGELIVISRTSSFAFKGRDLDAREIGDRLEVAALVEGSVQRMGNRLRIVAQLINTDTGAHIWSKSFDRTVEDLFAIQDEIANSIAEDLTEHLSPALGRTEKIPDLRAFDLYLRGRHSTHKRTESDLGWAITLFNQAIEIDPQFAPAYSGLADAYLLLPDYSNQAIGDIADKARASIDRALALDPDLAEAHASLGLLLKNLGDYRGSQNALIRAIQLNPNDSMARMWLAISLENQGRLNEAAPLLKRARTLDPLSFQINNRAGVNHWLRGEFDAANERFAAAIHIASTHPNGYWGRALVAWTQGQLEEAIAFFEDAIDRDPDRAVFFTQLGVVYLDLGLPKRASRWLDRAVELAPHWPAARFWQGLGVLASGDSAGAQRFAVDMIAGRADQPFQTTSAAALLALAGDLDLAASHFLAAEGLAGNDAALGNPWDIYYGVCFGAIKAAALLATERKPQAQNVATELMTLVENMQANGLSLPQANYCRASTAAVLGDAELALEELRTALESGPDRCWYVEFDPTFAGLRNEPVYKEAAALCEDRVSGR